MKERVENKLSIPKSQPGCGISPKHFARVGADYWDFTFASSDQKLTMKFVVSSRPSVWGGQRSQIAVMVIRIIEQLMKTAACTPAELLHQTVQSDDCIMHEEYIRQ